MLCLPRYVSALVKAHDVSASICPTITRSAHMRLLRNVVHLSGNSLCSPGPLCERSAFMVRAHCANMHLGFNFVHEDGFKLVFCLHCRKLRWRLCCGCMDHTCRQAPAPGRFSFCPEVPLRQSTRDEALGSISTRAHSSSMCNLHPCMAPECRVGHCRLCRGAAPLLHFLCCLLRGCRDAARRRGCCGYRWCGVQ